MPTLRRGVAATIIIGQGRYKRKYMIENDAIVDIITDKITYSEVRVVGMNMTGDCIRVITNETQLNEIPVNLIKNVKDCGKKDFSGVIIS